MKKTPDKNQEIRHAKPTFNLAAIAAGKKQPRWHSATDEHLNAHSESEELEPLDDDDDDKPKKKRKYTPMMRAVGLLSRRDHSKKELIQKLTLKGVPQEEAQQVVDRLEGMGLQSDQRYLEGQVRQRLASGYGPQKLKVDLSRHDLSDEAVANAIHDPENEWNEAAAKLIERRYGKEKLPIKEQTKAFNLLLRRGFSHEVARKAIQNLQK